jgi:hypothetical protein
VEWWKRFCCVLREIASGEDRREIASGEDHVHILYEYDGEWNEP